VYNQVLDTWTHAREQITKDMMAELEQDTDAKETRRPRLRESDLPDGPLGAVAAWSRSGSWPACAA